MHSLVLARYNNGMRLANETVEKFLFPHRNLRVGGRKGCLSLEYLTMLAPPNNSVVICADDTFAYIPD